MGLWNILESTQTTKKVYLEVQIQPSAYTLHRAVLTLLTFSARVRYPLRDGNWSDRQDQTAIPVRAPGH